MAKLVAGHPESLRLAGIPEQGVFLHFPMISDAFEDGAKRFDVIHGHIDYWSFPFARLASVPSVSTLHGRLDIDALRPVYCRYRSIPVVSISKAQRKPLPFMNWKATVYHGLPRDLLRFSPCPGQYLAFLGRISPEKRPDLAIDVAQKVGIPLKIAAKVDVVDKDYFEAVVKPRLSPPDVEYIGEINEAEKNEFLGNAIALLFTIDWPEPFGLAMIEAMACGTPVIARPYGSVPEIVEPGVTGCIASSVEELAAAVREAQKIPRAGVRAQFDKRFTAAQMAEGYERVYRRLVKKGVSKTRR
jgi:glycosyltransferase involved in cell wall biosynthesis